MCGASFRVYHDQKMTFLGAPGYQVVQCALGMARGSSRQSPKICQSGSRLPKNQSNQRLLSVGGQNPSLKFGKLSNTDISWPFLLGGSAGRMCLWRAMTGSMREQPLAR